jgi:hypothetical protein
MDRIHVNSNSINYALVTNHPSLFSIETLLSSNTSSKNLKFWIIYFPKHPESSSIYYWSALARKIIKIVFISYIKEVNPDLLIQYKFDFYSALIIHLVRT